MCFLYLFHQLISRCVFFSHVLRDSTPRFVGPLAGRSVGWSSFYFLAFLSFLSLLLLPKCSSDLLLHCSCPPAHDLGSRVYGLVFFNPGPESSTGERQLVPKKRGRCFDGHSGRHIFHRRIRATKRLLEPDSARARVRASLRRSSHEEYARAYLRARFYGQSRWHDQGQYWQSIRQIREFFYFKSIDELFIMARRRFFDSTLVHKNDTLRFLSNLLREKEDDERSRVP